MVEADTNVAPASSSITCAKMWRDGRLTTKRGRTAVPLIRLRTRECRRRRAALLPLPLILTVDITYLPFRPCGGWSHSRSVYLGLIRFGNTQFTDVCGCFANKLFVDTRDGHGAAFDSKCDAFWGVDVDAVREAQLQFDVIALGNDAVTRTVQFQFLGVAFGHTDDHVVDQGACQTVE